MSKSGTRMLTATATLLALASPVAHGIDAANGTRYAAIDPSAFRQYALPANTTAAAAPNTPKSQKKPKADKPRILTGLHNFRTPAQRALDRVKQSEHNCGPGAIACPKALRGHQNRDPSWAYAASQQRLTEAAESPAVNTPTDNAPALVRPNGDIPGLIPGRESNYKFSLNLPLGRYENVLLQANVRKNIYNVQNASDSTLRADWSLRF